MNNEISAMREELAELGRSVSSLAAICSAQQDLLKALASEGSPWFRKGSAAENAAQTAPEPVKKTNFGDYITFWRNAYKRGKAETTNVFMDAKQNILIKWFGDMFIEDITPADVQSFLNARSAKFKRATVKEDWAFLKEVLDSAAADDLIAKNPARDRRVYNPAKAGSGTAALTREQISAILRDIPKLKDDQERCLIALLAYTSMRREEVLGMTWENVDFKNRCLHITQALVYPKGHTVLKETKTAGSARCFPMCKALYDILWPCRKGSGFVISKNNGEPISSMLYRKLWKRLEQHIELYGMTAINFRTTFATMAVASGVDIKTTQSLMGHTTPEMTLKVYAKEEKTRLDGAVEKVGNFLSGKSLIPSEREEGNNSLYPMNEAKNSSGELLSGSASV